MIHRKWEYKWIHSSAKNVADSGEGSALESVVQEGYLGWELVGVLPIMQNGTTNEVFFILKRPHEICHTQWTR